MSTSKSFEFYFLLAFPFFIKWLDGWQTAILASLTMITLFLWHLLSVICAEIDKKIYLNKE